jgi:hypothetical protein
MGDAKFINIYYTELYTKTPFETVEVRKGL